MSGSISELLGNIGNTDVSRGIKQTKTNSLINNDNPEPEGKTVAGTLNHKKRIVDMYYHDMRIRDKHPRNGLGYTYDKNHGHLPHFKKNVDYFYSDGSIDPNQIRQQTDPESALPDDYVQGTLYDKILLPDGTYTTADSDELLSTGIESFERYKSKFGTMSLDSK